MAEEINNSSELTNDEISKSGGDHENELPTDTRQEIKDQQDQQVKQDSKTEKAEPEFEFAKMCFASSSAATTSTTPPPTEIVIDEADEDSDTDHSITPLNSEAGSEATSGPADRPKDLPLSPTPPVPPRRNFKQAKKTKVIDLRCTNSNSLVTSVIRKIRK